MILGALQQTSFKRQQLHYARVREAYAEKENVVNQYFQDKGLSQNGYSIFVRVFKYEKQLEVWTRSKDAATFSLLHTYDICASSGLPGPKRKEGDGQVPEGVYHVNHFNPMSRFHLSLGINYPNASDKILSDRKNPGSAIYIHGNCVTIGCMPITDEMIKEVYILAVEARNNGQQQIPIHIFPARLDHDGMQQLQNTTNDAVLLTFWKNLQLIFDDFEKTHSLRDVHVNKKGEYYF
jgi:murein L,D-transpeptidase YafK